jgi:hypothetical protein
MGWTWTRTFGVRSSPDLGLQGPGPDFGQSSLRCKVILVLVADISFKHFAELIFLKIRTDQLLSQYNKLTASNVMNKGKWLSSNSLYLCGKLLHHSSLSSSSIKNSLSTSESIFLILWKVFWCPKTTTAAHESSKGNKSLRSASIPNTI